MKNIKLIKFLNFFRSVNRANSNISVNCVNWKDCSSRHSTLCKTCAYNIGVERKSYYISK